MLIVPHVDKFDINFYKAKRFQNESMSVTFISLEHLRMFATISTEE